MGLLQDTELLSPGVLVNAAHGSGGSGGGSGGSGGGGSSLENSRHLSRSNVDIPRSSGTEDPKRQLPRKRSDSSTYELDTIQQHQAFLSRWGCPRGPGGKTMRPNPGKDGDSDGDSSQLGTVRPTANVRVPCPGSVMSLLGPQLCSQDKVSCRMRLWSCTC